MDFLSTGQDSWDFFPFAISRSIRLSPSSFLHACMQNLGPHTFSTFSQTTVCGFVARPHFRGCYQDTTTNCFQDVEQLCLESLQPTTGFYLQHLLVAPLLNAIVYLLQYTILLNLVYVAEQPLVVETILQISAEKEELSHWAAQWDCRHNFFPFLRPTYLPGLFG